MSEVLNKRNSKDFYSTPEHTTRALLENYDISRFRNILEPASGSGLLVKILNEFRHNDSQLITNELRKEEKADFYYDYAKYSQRLFSKVKEEFHGNAPDLIVTNPPFFH